MSTGRIVDQLRERRKGNKKETVASFKVHESNTRTRYEQGNEIIEFDLPENLLNKLGVPEELTDQLGIEIGGSTLEFFQLPGTDIWQIDIRK